MSYNRVIPRDLFNEGNLLKCYGQIYIELETMREADAALVEGDIENGFHIEQDEDDGSISIVNVHLEVRGTRYPLRRPLNARGSYPLYLSVGEDEDEIAVFCEAGRFTEEMKAFLRGDSA